MKNYTYETVTGPVTIEVDEHWYNALLEFDAEETNNDRSHSRADHKYAPGEPVSLESLEYEGESLADSNDDISLVELKVDLERALVTVTPLQRRYYVMSRLHGYSVAEVARLHGKDRTTIREAVKAADKKVKKFFGTPPFSALPTAI